MSKGILYSAVAATIWLFASCAPARFVKPLTMGTTAVGASAGGPLIKYGNATIPVPLSSIVVGYGYRDDITFFGGVHTTALAFGVVQTDLGVLKKLVMQDAWRPAIVVSAVTNMMFDKWEHHFSCFPQLDANLYWHCLHRPNYFYFGISNWFDFNIKRSEGDAQKTHWLPVVELGHRWVNRKMDYIMELKYIAPNHSNKDLVTDYTGIANQGAIGVYLGLVWKHEKRLDR